MHDLVDNVALEAKQAGKCAALYAQEKLPSKTRKIDVVAGSGLSYVLPSVVYGGAGKVDLKFRLKEKIEKKTIVAKSGDLILGKMFVLGGTPGEMLTLQVEKNGAKKSITIEIQ